MRHRKPARDSKNSENLFSAVWGFTRDCLQVIFKYPPDPDQEMSDFIMEKAGAFSVLLFAVVVLVFVVIGVVNR